MLLIEFNNLPIDELTNIQQLMRHRDEILK